MPIRNIKASDRFWLKSENYSLKDIFGTGRPQSQLYAQTFEGGSLFQGFLAALNYHRWHSPVEGRVIDDYLVEGHPFLDRSQFYPKELDSLASSQTLLAALATRRIIILEADNPDIGQVGLVYIGMADISSCLSSVKIGQRVVRGQELGLF